MKRIAFIVWLAVACGIWPAPAARTDLPQQERIYQARDQVLPALVHIQPISEYYARGKKQKTTSVGSGVIISRQGHVVTNYHVVGRVRDLLVTLASKDRVSAELVGGDPLTDVAVIQLATGARQHLPKPAVLGDSDQLQVGEYVMALGSPLALSRSVSLGVVSCVDRYFPGVLTLPTGEQTGRFNTWIQTDAAINPGNSGGPLINLRGEIVGINSRMAFGENLGFAIPSNVVRDVVERLIAEGRVRRSWIGLDLQSLEELHQHFGAKDRGALVRTVTPASPAADAGILPGDLLLSCNGTPVSARFDEEVPGILKRIADTPPGTPMQLILRRDGKEMTVVVTTLDLGKVITEELECPAWGMTVKEITRPVMLALNLDSDEGVLVTSVTPGSELSTQLDAGDVIRQVNDTAVRNLDGFRDLYFALLEQQPAQVLLRTRRLSATRLVLVKPTYGRTSLEDELQAP